MSNGFDDKLWHDCAMLWGVDINKDERFSGLNKEELVDKILEIKDNE